MEGPPCITLVGDAEPARTARALDLSSIRQGVISHRIERLVGELRGEVERGEVVVNTVFILHAQRVAKQLLDMATLKLIN
jgi:hypothetical protein